MNCYDFSSFKKLREQMYEVGYTMYPFTFSYKGIETFVAAYIITDEERKKEPLIKYGLFRLIFMKKTNLDETFECCINSIRFVSCDLTKLRHFFKIPFQKDGTGFLDYFADKLNRQCPKKAYKIVDPDLVKIERRCLCKKLKLDPERCYRSKIMRLGKKTDGTPKQRNPYKYQLALKVFPRASYIYRDAYDVTYCYTDDPLNEVSEEIAIERFIKRENQRIKVLMV